MVALPEGLGLCVGDWYEVVEFGVEELVGGEVDKWAKEDDYWRWQFGPFVVWLLDLYDVLAACDQVQDKHEANAES